MIFISLLIISIVTSILYYKYKHKYWKNKNVVFEEPEIFFGNYRDIFTFQRTIMESDLKRYRKFTTDKYVGSYMGVQPILMVKDPGLLKMIMSKDFFYFHHRGINFSRREMLTMNLFSTSGDTWKVLRQYLTPLFSSGKIKNMFTLITECCSEFEKHIDKVANTTDAIGVRDLTKKLTMEIIGSCGFGLKLDTMVKEHNQFREIGDRMFQNTKIKALKTYLRQMMPSIYHLLGLKVATDNIFNFFLSLITNVISERKKNHIMRHDFVDLMMSLQEKGSISGDGIESLVNKNTEKLVLPIDLSMITAQCFVFFGAGYETSSTTMSFALLELAKNPNIQNKLYEEIEKSLKDNNNKITYEAIQELKYLDMVVSETLRKYPVVPNITRKCTTSYKVPDSDLIIDKGTMIHIPVYGIHHDPLYYPNPEQFIPERFTKEEIEKRQQYTYLPFGDGSRICIGMRLGKLQTMAGLITILKNHKVELTDKMKVPLRFMPESTALLTIEDDIWLKFVARNKPIAT